LFSWLFQSVGRLYAWMIPTIVFTKMSSKDIICRDLLRQAIVYNIGQVCFLRHFRCRQASPQARAFRSVSMFRVQGTERNLNSERPGRHSGSGCECLNTNDHRCSTGLDWTEDTIWSTCQDNTYNINANWLIRPTFGGKIIPRLDSGNFVKSKWIYSRIHNSFVGLFFLKAATRARLQTAVSRVCSYLIQHTRNIHLQ